MSSWVKKKLYTPAAFDGLFALTGVVAATGLVLDAGRAYPAISAAPLTKGASLLGVMVAALALAIASTRFDQKMADDFLFHSLTKSAFIAMFVMLFTAVLWDILFSRNVGMYSSNTSVAVMAAAWAMSWFYTRLRGTRA